MTRRLIPDPPQNLRERRRADGTTRIWWEPSAAARRLGFAPVELDAARLTWSVRETARLNRDLAEAIASGRRAAPASSGRSVEALVHNYRQSLTWRRLRPKTQADYNAAFRLICSKWGVWPVRDFTKPVLRQWYETLHANAGQWQAAALIRKFSLLFSHAEMIGWRDEGSNPCTRLKLMTPAGRSRTASWDEFDRLLATADRIGLPSIGTAMVLSLFQGQRQTDVFQARVGDFRRIAFPAPDSGTPLRAWVWFLTRSKRGNTSAIRLHDEAAPRLQQALAAAKSAGRWAPEDRLLVDERLGRAYDDDLFQRRWQEVRAATIAADASGASAPLAGLQFRDLRRTFGVLSRQGGGGRDDIGDVLGNSIATNAQLAAIYTPGQIDTASRAVSAIRRPAAPNGKKQA